VFSGVGKTRDELRAALRAGILLFNLESESELAALAECATQLRKIAEIALRLSPGLAAKTHPYISISLQQPNIGSQITEVAPFAATARRIAQLVGKLREDGHRIRFVDLGGGLGIDYEHPDQDLAQFKRQVKRYAEALLAALRGLKVHLLLEPGRSIIGPAGALVTSVVYRKTNGNRNFLIVDAAMNDLIRPALYGAVHEIVPVRPPADGPTETVDIVGPVCETGDFFARDCALPEVTEGDLLAILDAGAYGMAIASNYNTRPRAAEVMVDGKSVKLIRRRETIRALLAPER
jgi:diaminopimelate decarboxylase